MAEILSETLPSGIRILTINRPKQLNALSQAVKESLVKEFQEADADASVRAIVITGAGDRAFAAGQDLREAQKFEPEDISAWISSFHDLYSSVLACRKPTIAAVNGYAVGAALQLALLCDVRIGSVGARVGMPEVDDGIPCITGVWSLYHVLGHARTTELVLTGRMLDAEEAFRWGLLNEIAPADELREYALRWAELLAGKPAVAVRLNKERLSGLLVREQQDAEEFANKAHASAYRSGEPQRRMKEFLEKRGRGRTR